jgi:hypothetical protein
VIKGSLKLTTLSLEPALGVTGKKLADSTNNDTKELKDLVETTRTELEEKLT